MKINTTNYTDGSRDHTISDDHNSVTFAEGTANDGCGHQPDSFVRCLGQLEEDFGPQDSGLSQETLLAGIAKITGLAPERIALPSGQDGGHDWQEQGEKSYIGWAYEVEPAE